ncbi:hypothetical protein AB1Y20_014086 [Prymnesium parvum]|uniref:RWD domain-containing protein n=1 Tax=Prymnesium parvum TaxID=97485 RepID=A0AB34IHA5_PRYPA
MEEAAREEREAMLAIMGPECFWQDPADASRYAIRVAPLHDAASESVGALVLAVAAPRDYPSSASPHLSLPREGELHGAPPEWWPAAGWSPSDAERAQLSRMLAEAVEARRGEAAVFDGVDVLRSWLEAHTLEQREAAGAAAGDEAGEGAAASDDDELDEEDMDGEMIEALRPVLRGDGKRLKALDEAAELKDGSPAQRAALKAIWRSLTAAQKAQMVESSDEEDAPPARGGRKSQSAPPPAKRDCPKGHSLTAVNTKPADYATLDGNVFNCDVCDADGKYSGGAYHCGVCRNWDCCVKCGSRPAGAVESRAPPKKKKGKR